MYARGQRLPPSLKCQSFPALSITLGVNARGGRWLTVQATSLLPPGIHFFASVGSQRILMRIHRFIAFGTINWTSYESDLFYLKNTKNCLYCVTWVKRSIGSRKTTASTARRLWGRGCLRPPTFGQQRCNKTDAPMLGDRFRRSPK